MGLFTLPVHASPPDPITTLQAVTGSLLGSVQLNWIAPNQPGGTVLEYRIRYRPNSPIVTQQEFDNASQAPNPPTPGAPGTAEQKLVSGLSPGVTFYFAIQSRGNDNVNPFSQLSNSPGAQAQNSCGNAINGQGTANLLSSSSVQRGDFVDFNFDFIAGSAGIEPGGKLAFRIPNNWPVPQTSQSASPGYIEVVSAPVPIVAQVEGSLAIFTVSGTTALTIGQTVQVSYRNIVVPCTSPGQVSFVFQSKAAACGQLADILNQPSPITILSGNPLFIAFNLYNMMVQLDTTVGVGMTAYDGCNNAVPLATTREVQVAGFVSDGNNYVPDTAHATLSNNSDLSNPYTNAVGSITINAGQTGATVYYKLDATAGSAPRRLELSHPDLNGGNFNFYSHLEITPVSNGITGVSVDTGTIQPGQLTVTFTPDGDNQQDVAYVNFTMPSETAYQVDLSSDGFNTIVRTLYGYGTTARIPWYGDLEIYGGPPQFAPAGTYNVRIRDNANFFTNQTSSITVSAGGITGLVLVDGSSAPIVDADVYLDQNYTHRSGRTDGSGRYTIHGLKPGTYQMRVEKAGYQVEELTAAVPLGLLAYDPVYLEPGSVLKIHFTRSGTGLPEIWGGVQAHTSNWSQQSFGTLHFQEGATGSDAGDFWNGTPSSYTVLNLSPGLEYTVDVNLPGYGVDDSTYTLSLGETREVVIPLDSRPTVSGAVTLPPGTNPNGIWISVEAGPDADGNGIFDDQDPSNRYYGGGYLSGGQEQGTYQIFGVEENQNYLLVLHAQGFVNEQINVAVALVDVTNADFPMLDTGGTITGDITINGDTTGLDDLDGSTDGYFPMHVNSWSPNTYNGSFVMVSLPTHATQTSGPYTLSGLEDGTYQLFTNLQGFEITPPGQINVTVTNGSGNKDLVFQEFTGALSGTLTLPGNASNWGDVRIDLLPYDPNSETVTTTPTSSTYNFSRLGTGYYTMRAYYATTGYIAEKSISIINGQASQANIDLTGNTYSITGTVTTTAGSPFNSLTGLVNQSTPTTMLNLETNIQEPIDANRIVVERVRQNSFYGGGQGGGPSVLSYDPKETYFGFYGTNGSYTVANLPQGVYRIYNNGELDNDTDNGDEIAEVSSIIHVNGNLVQNFVLTDGYEVSGTLRVVSGISESGRDIDLMLQNSRHQMVASKRVPVTGTVVTFALEHIPAGDYLLSARDNMSPTKYVARDVSIKVVASDVTGKEINLISPARIQGRLRIATSGELLTSSNYQQFLTDDYRIEARSNPWVQGNWGSAQHPLIDSNGMFNLYLNPGTYDILFRTDGFIGEGYVAQGKKQFVALTLSGIETTEGVTENIGTIDLEEGTPLSGTVTDTGNAPLSNILVIAFPSGDDRHEPLSATTNHLGQFTLHGLDPDFEYDVIASPRPESRDTRFLNFDGPRYGEVRRNRVTVTTTLPPFQLQLANGVVRGKAITPDSGPLLTPFDGESEPGAMIIMNKIGTTPEDNPLGDIEVKSDPDGTFEVSGLVPGVYNLWVLAEGYSNGLVKNINVGSSVVPLGDIYVVAGQKMYGTLTNPDGSLPSLDDAGTIVAVRDSFRDLMIGSMQTDASGNITGYVLSGFQTDRAYDILLFNDDNDVIILATGLINNQTTERNFVIADNNAPSFITQAQKDQSGNINLTYEFTKPLRNSSIDLNFDNQPDDSDLPERITRITGGGTLTFAANALSSDRRRLKFSYAPAPGETQFILRTDVTFNALNANGANYTLTRDTTFYIGVGKSRTDKITNISGGKTELPDKSQFSAQAGTFGDDASGVVEVTFRSADDTETLAGAGALAKAENLGLSAYPSEMAMAIAKAKASSVTPLSSFYDIFLPANVSHFFPEGREAQICLNYDSTVSDPYSLNVYYFNPATNEYLLENQNKTVDTVNERICASISHASIFTILDSSDAIVTGGAYTGELAIMNFPNPFNLKQKTVTLQDPGSSAASQSVEGTMIKMSVPTNMSGSIEIQIFNAVGEKVRTLNSNVASGGSHFYLEWDGKNDHGEKVASGIYIARFTIGGANERFFKMAVIK